ncbi:hypothetical protein Leryth_013191 [Lithospermum erythrorhizon]|nr:hypothetical protein Leryth_013191 [Lithospermum erythrorhizon]
MDEDESMPWLITSMAEGLMLPPPFHSVDDEDQEHHLQLWSYSDSQSVGIDTIERTNMGALKRAQPLYLHGGIEQ